MTRAVKYFAINISHRGRRGIHYVMARDAAMAMVDTCRTPGLAVEQTSIREITLEEYTRHAGINGGEVFGDGFVVTSATTMDAASDEVQP